MATMLGAENAQKINIFNTKDEFDNKILDLSHSQNNRPLALSPDIQKVLLFNDTEKTLFLYDIKSKGFSKVIMGNIVTALFNRYSDKIAVLFQDGSISTFTVLDLYTLLYS